MAASDSSADDLGLHDHTPDAGTPAARRALRLAFGLTATFTAVELVGGFVFKSLALSADAAHMFSDTIALGVALGAQRIASRPASATHSFGWRRAEVIAAFGNGLLLVAVCGWIVFTAFRRFGSPVETNALGLTLVAVAGLLINLICARYLRAHASHNMNVRAAALHTISDAAGSLGAITAGLVLLGGGPHWVDPAISILIACLVLIAGIKLLRDTTHVLLEATPSHLDPVAIAEALTGEPSVLRVHHMHVWSLAPGSPALSAHVELSEIETLHEAQQEGNRLKQLLIDKFDLRHTTLELECHPCAPDMETH